MQHKSKDKPQNIKLQYSWLVMVGQLLAKSCFHHQAFMDENIIDFPVIH